jgi:cell division initiation protein
LRLTPLDIQNHRFATRLRGLDPVEVESFLSLLSEDYEALLRERDALADRVRTLERRVDDLSQDEKILRDTLVTAQTLSEDLKRTAMKESEVLVSEAEVKAEKVLDAAHRRAAKLAEDIRTMRQLRGRMSAALRQTLQMHMDLLETLSKDGNEEAEAEKVAYLTRQKNK